MVPGTISASSCSNPTVDVTGAEAVEALERTRDEISGALRVGLPGPTGEAPADVHRAAGRKRLKPGHHWLRYVGAVVFFFVVIPMMLIDGLDRLLQGRRRRAPRAAEPQTPPEDRPAAARRGRARDRLSPTMADGFRTVVAFPLDQVRVEGEAGQPRGFATFRLRFTDGSWLEVGRLGEPEDADHFLRTISG
ncbi:hypothetical protein [Streptomyces milbemycinicus]|uniref:Uncharacterized protein n=1 Tax=Streptomyces milbemycinicus TaxID=476552 RepID=A0ABW8LP84_9ACTN